MKTPVGSTLTEADVTPETVYLNRRQYLKASAVAAAVLVAPKLKASESTFGADPAPLWLQSQNKQASPSPFSTTEKLTPYEYVTGYNNFYEFGTDKDDPARYAESMTIDPWSLKVGGLVNQPGRLHLEALLTGFDLDERIYRFRCVEAWSMVVPWLGFW